MNQNIRIFILSVILYLSIYSCYSQTCDDNDPSHLMDSGNFLIHLGFIDVSGNTGIPVNTLLLTKDLRFTIPASGYNIVSCILFL